jgi:hypothetical protein
MGCGIDIVTDKQHTASKNSPISAEKAAFLALLRQKQAVFSPFFTRFAFAVKAANSTQTGRL